MRIFLIGFMSSGKSKKGKKIANKLGYSFFDLDNLIEKKYQKSVSDIFLNEGEKKFREYENDVLKDFINLDNFVLATGGGTPCFNNNMEIMTDLGITIYLKAETEFLLSRLLNSKNNDRPLIKDKKGEELKNYISKTLSLREEFYLNAKLIFVVPGTATNVIIDRIIRLQNENMF